MYDPGDESVPDDWTPAEDYADSDTFSITPVGEEALAEALGDK